MYTKTSYYSAKYRTVIYNGDVDACVPFVGAQVRQTNPINYNTVSAGWWDGIGVGREKSVVRYQCECGGRVHA